MKEVTIFSWLARLLLMQPSMWFGLFPVRIHRCLVFHTLLAMNPRLGVGEGWYSGHQFPAWVSIVLSLEQKVALNLSEICEFLLAWFSMTLHSTVCCVNYCACFHQFRVTCKCPKCVFCLSAFVQVVEEPVEQQQSSECAPQNYQAMLFSCCWPKPVKKKKKKRGFLFLRISSHCSLTHWQGCCQLLTPSSWVLCSGSNSFNAACGFPRRIQCCSSFIVFYRIKLSRRSRLAMFSTTDPFMTSE